jgi:hypothetical protein
VAMEQLLALMEHAQSCELPDCPECARLEDVLEAAEGPLLKPFR